MAKLFSKNRLKHLHALLKRGKISGFTLLELLIAMFVAGLIVVGLLTLSAQITEANQRDAGRSQIQQDMQAAIDYVSQDLREAVFVYNGQCLQGVVAVSTANLSCPGLANYIPAEMTSGDRIPVLAFWRTSPLPDTIKALCTANLAELASDDSAILENNVLVRAGVPCVAANSYTLVVYALDRANDRDDNGVWQGKARLVRYQLPQFREGATDQSQQSTGYVNPLASSDLTFQQWPLTVTGGGVVSRQATAQSPGRPTVTENPPQVLVDFVDGDLDRSTAINPSCQEFGTTPEEQENSLTPLATTNRGFYGCVRGGGVVPPRAPTDPPLIVDNQDVLLVLTGNVSGYSGAFPLKALGEPEPEGRISPVQTRVLVRGVLQKG
jgi:prepilin-type N-terminal cleavage/methylation domain-containing protein